MKVFSKAFTLAEILLTLAIIGVVAALTIPAVITKVTKDQYVVGLKKAYSTLKSVERQARQEHGDMQNWDWTEDTPITFEKYFKPHFDILKDCGPTTETGCFPTGRTYLKGSDWNFDYNTTSYYKMITSDGMAFAYSKSSYSNYKGFFAVDVNGLKAPNRYGRDIFYFDVFPSDLGIKPEGSYDAMSTARIPTSAVDETCLGTRGYPGGSYCAAKVLSEGAMNY